MILIINNKSRFIRQLCSFIKKSGSAYKVISFGKIRPDYAKNFDAVILSGGVGSPADANSPDFSKEIKLIKKLDKPVFGICLGFEVICHAYGTRVLRMGYLEKGIVKTRIKKKGDVFKGCRREIKVFEDHQWDVKSVSRSMEILATSKDGIEAVRHKTKPIYGVQFHPEIRKNNQGHKALENFLNLI
jgi:GMP synthase (glutamine-hydrolysing)